MILSPKTEGRWRKRDCDCLLNRVSRKQDLITTSSSLAKWIPAHRRKREGHQTQITSNQLPKQAWQIIHCRKLGSSRGLVQLAAPAGLPQLCNRNAGRPLTCAFWITTSGVACEYVPVVYQFKFNGRSVFYLAFLLPTLKKKCA